MSNIKKWEERQEDDDFRGLSLDYAEQEIAELRAALEAAPVPEGWQLVPVEPASNQLVAARRVDPTRSDAYFHSIFKAMLTAGAAPVPEGVNGIFNCHVNNNTQVGVRFPTTEDTLFMLAASPKVPT